MRVNKVLQGTNWALLRDQKSTLIKAIEQYPDLAGLLNWIDALQDSAETEGYPVEWLTEGETAHA